MSVAKGRSLSTGGSSGHVLGPGAEGTPGGGDTSLAPVPLLCLMTKRDSIKAKGQL